MPIALILLILGWNYLIDRDLKSDRAEVAARKEKRDRVCGCKLWFSHRASTPTPAERPMRCAAELRVGNEYQDAETAGQAAET